MIVLDASVLIGHLEPADAHHRRATDLLLRHAQSPLVASVMTVSEVLVGARRAGRMPDATSALMRLGLERVPITSEYAERLSELRHVTRLKLPDCCILLAAEVVEGTIATFDDRLAARAHEMGRLLEPVGP